MTNLFGERDHVVFYAVFFAVDVHFPCVQSGTERDALIFFDSVPSVRDLIGVGVFGEIFVGVLFGVIFAGRLDNRFACVMTVLVDVVKRIRPVCLEVGRRLGCQRIDVVIA